MVLQECPQLTFILVIVFEHHVSPDLLIVSVCDELKVQMFLYVFKVLLLVKLINYLKPSWI